MFLILVSLAAAAVFYYYLSGIQKRFRYWKDREVPQRNKQNLIYGDTKRAVLREITLSELYREFYYQFKKVGAKHGGIYNMKQPVWILTDPSIIKSVLVKDFNYFTAHMMLPFKTLLVNNLFHLDGEPWKDMRRKLTPTFTSGKMKMMYEMVLNKSEGLANLVGDMVKTGEMEEIKELLARYTTDVIGTCGFGIECDSIADKNAEFFQKGQDIFNIITAKKAPTLLTMAGMALGLIKHKMYDLSPVENFFRNVVNDTVKYREDHKIVRKDFMHLMIQLKNRGTITDILNETDIYQKSEGKDGLSMEDMAGQCMLFFTAGFETSSTTMSFALLELSHHQDIQDKLRKEIRHILSKHNGVLSYEALQEMTYCEWVIQETLRKYPPVADLPRMCTKNYRIPNTDIVIEKNTAVVIPMLAIQNDPDYFPEPEKFKPERFSPENKHNIVDYTYMPFGEGPRQCLGLRFGMMQSKTGIVSLINRFKFNLNSKTPYPPKFSPGHPILAVHGGIWLDVEEVK